MAYEGYYINNKSLDMKTYANIGRFLTMTGEWKTRFNSFLESQDNYGKTSKEILKECEQCLLSCTSDSSTASKDAIARCKQIEKILQKKRPNNKDSSDSNLIIEEIDLKKNTFGTTSAKLEFDSVTGKLIKEPLENLVIEELDVAEFS